MANIIVLEIQKHLITPIVEHKIRSISKFYEIFDNRVVAILLESHMNWDNIQAIVNHDKPIFMETYHLNNFARNRMINNFESERPELTLTLMGCGAESKLIKIREKHVKGTK